MAKKPKNMAALEIKQPDGAEQPDKDNDADFAPPPEEKKQAAYIRELPGFLDMKPSEIVSALAAKGIVVKVGNVNAVKSAEKKKAGGKVAPKATNEVLSIGDAVQEVAALAKKVGGLSELQKIVIALHQ